LEGNVLEVSPDALGHARGVGVRCVQQQDRDAFTDAGDHICRAEELGDLARERLLHGPVGLGPRAVWSHQAYGEEVLVAGGAGGLPGEELVEGFLAEDAA